MSISQGGAEGGVSKRQFGKKNRRKQPVLQLGQPGDGASQSNGVEHFVWESHPNVMKLFVAVVNVGVIIIIIIIIIIITTLFLFNSFFMTSSLQLLSCKTVASFLNQPD